MMGFFRTLVSTTGINCITEIGKKPDGSTWAKNHPCYFKDDGSTQHLVQTIQARGNDTYFALGSFAPTRDGGFSRTKDQCIALKALWLDIDAGEKKYKKHGDAVYPTQQDAINDFWRVLHLGELPVPTYVVSSGEGLHIYWAADSDIAPAEWDTIAHRLQSYCQKVGLRVDTSRTTDKASVLRPINTRHFDSGRNVTLLQTNYLFTKQDLLQRMNALPVPLTPTNIHTMRQVIPGIGSINMPSNAMQQSSMAGMVEYPPASFGKIIELQTYENTGCKQLMHCYTNQSDLEEPMWYAALSVAQFCSTDREEWIHKISHAHPEYERGATERKAAQAKGPMGCSDFERLRPNGCDGCPHRNRITSPIVLGHNPSQRPVIVSQLVNNKQENFLIPELPYPFFRKPEGGVYINVPKVLPDGKLSKDEVEEFCVCPHDLYIFERVKESSHRQLFYCRYHSPHDGVVEFILDSETIHTANDKFKSVIIGAGIPIYGKERWTHLMNFLNLSRNKLVMSRPAIEAVKQMGWQDNGEFVLGDMVITKTGHRPAPLGDRVIAKKYAKVFKPSAKGDDADAQLELWNKTLQSMYGSKNALPNQFVIAAGLGSVFASKFALENHSGGIISLVSAESGRGKTFTCQVASRIFGDPTEMTFSSKSGVTVNGLMNNLGYINSIPILRDEITELNSEEIANLVYDSTRLADKERAQSSANDIRDNRNKWRTFMFATANSSMYDMLTVGRDVADGPMRRVTEIHIPRLDYLSDTPTARAMAKQLNSIRGIAGQRIIEWIVRNEDKAQDAWEKVTHYVMTKYNIANEERYWANHLIAACTGAIIGDKLGLLPFEPTAIIDYAGELLEQMRSRVGRRTVEKSDYLSQFYTDNTDHTLIVSGQIKDDTTVMVADLPRKAAMVRYEVDAGMMYINPSQVKRWCNDRRIVLADFETELRKRGGRPAVRKNMLANTTYAKATDAQKVWAIPIERATT